MGFAVNIVCDCCDNAGLTIQCSTHPLIGGKNLTAQLVKELHQAMVHGDGMWGDILYEQDMAALAAETAAEKAARIRKVEKSEEASADRLKEYELHKRGLLNNDAKTGAIKHKTGRACRDAEMMAKWVIGKQKMGNYQEWPATDPKAKTKPSVRPKGVPSNAIFWSYGCEPHAKGCCSHLHPGEAGYEDAKAGRNPNVEALLAKAQFLTKPTASRSKPLVAVVGAGAGSVPTRCSW